ncbi:MAG: glycosyltransferase family 4 protein, partial [Planctomycetota bacterium]
VGAPLTIVGSGPEEDRLRRLAADVPDVEFTGGLTHDEAIRRIFAADFLVFPSRWEEPFGLTIIEAFACGRPVIAANIGAPRELISHDVTGLLVPPDEPEALSSAARYLTREDEHRRGMALNARRRYLQRHTPAVHRRRLLQLFTRVGAMRERQLTA